MSAPHASGLDGIIVAETALSDVDGERGKLMIRGYSVEELVERATFEDVCGLMWDGAWPSTDERDAMRASLADARALRVRHAAVARRRARQPGRDGGAADRGRPPARRRSRRPIECG